MLPAPRRMRSADEFRSTVRAGVRAKRDSVIVYARCEEPSTHPGVRVGFVVSKAVGNAVTRNRVKRRLRHLAYDLIDQAPSGTRLVVRAFAPAAYAGDSLGIDLAGAWHTCLGKLAKHATESSASRMR